MILAAITSAGLNAESLLILAGFAVLVAATLGFAAGRVSAPKLNSPVTGGLRELSRVDLVGRVLSHLDSCSEAGAELKSRPAGAASDLVASELSRRSASIAQLLLDLAGVFRPTGSDASTSPSPAASAKLDWVIEPADAETNLPGQTSFESNLEKLLAWNKANRASSGLLCIAIDKFPTLQSRHGAEVAKELLQKFTSVVCRGLRDEDLLVRTGDASFALLMPGLFAGEVSQRTSQLRDAVRGFPFQAGQGGPVVLVTASFGGSMIGNEDHTDLVFSRANNALHRSQRLGRNQLHLHDGLALVHCAAAV